MKKLALLSTLTLFTGCAPFAGASAVSGISASACKAVEAESLSERGEYFLILQLDERYAPRVQE